MIKTIKAWIGINEKGGAVKDSNYYFTYVSKKMATNEMDIVTKCTIQYEVKNKKKGECK
jgi:hypothetical protein